MQFILFVIILICFMASFMCFLDTLTIRSTLDAKYWKICFVFGFILSFWVLISCLTYEWETKNHYLRTYLIKKIPVVFIDEKIINLHDYFSANIDEGQAVLCEETISGWYGGIYWVVPPNEKYKFTLED